MTPGKGAAHADLRAMLTETQAERDAARAEAKHYHEWGYKQADRVRVLETALRKSHETLSAVPTYIAERPMLRGWVIDTIAVIDVALAPASPRVEACKCPCGEPACAGVNDRANHQCGGPREACLVPGCPECGTGTKAEKEIDRLRAELAAEKKRADWHRDTWHAFAKSNENNHKALDAVETQPPVPPFPTIAERITAVVRQRDEEIKAWHKQHAKAQAERDDEAYSHGLTKAALATANEENARLKAEADEERFRLADLVVKKDEERFIAQAALGRAVTALQSAKAVLVGTVGSEEAEGEAVECIDAILADPTGKAAGEAWAAAIAVAAYVEREGNGYINMAAGIGVHLKRLVEAIAAVDARKAVDPDADLLDLLAKLATTGGRRTGELRRRGWLTWEVTEAGRAALDARKAGGK